MLRRRTQDLGVGVGEKSWSAAACCCFPPRELARGNFGWERHSPPASWLASKRQQAAALQRFAGGPNEDQEAVDRRALAPGNALVGWR